MSYVSFLLPHQFFKTKPITIFGGSFTIPAPTRLSWCLTAYSGGLVSACKPAVLCVCVYILVFMIGE